MRRRPQSGSSSAACRRSADLTARSCESSRVRGGAQSPLGLRFSKPHRICEQPCLRRKVVQVAQPFSASHSVAGSGDSNQT